MKKYKNLIFAGTFDHLHIGHKKMLKKAFEAADHVSIFITSSKLYHSKPLANLIPTYEVRRGAVEQYLRERNWLNRTTFFKLDTIYGPSVKNVEFDSILVTEGTKQNAKRINLRRKKNCLKEFKILVVPYVRGDDGEIVTSERIRKGEIDREGHNFQFLISNFPHFAKASRGTQKKQLILPENLREELRKPLGLVIKSQFPNVEKLQDTARKTVQSINRLDFQPSMVITVGDIVTMSLMKIGFEPDVKIVDLRSRREKISNFQFPISNQVPNPNYQICKTKNDAGTINLQAAKVIQKSFKNFLTTKKKQLIIVKGEEDLLALPAILFAPLQSLVLYGQWNLGVVAVEVTEEKKKKVIKILKKFLI